MLREHWDTWITEETFQQMADREVEVIRVPMGDWTLKPYGPYVGCTEGATDKITWLLDTAEKYNLKVLLDVHAVKGSQNGYDNSGLSNRTLWTDENNFNHWDQAYGEWMGVYDEAEGGNNCGDYQNPNMDNIEWAKDTVQGILTQWGSHPALYAIEPVNEPWWCTDLDLLKTFYRDVRTMMVEQQPRLLFVFHDAFHGDAGTWNDLFEDDDKDNVVMDTHRYFAWGGQHGDIGTYCDEYGADMSHLQEVKYPVWVGEWSLATDVCALWLGGFNDANTDATRTCQRVECPTSYMKDQAVDFDRTAAELGPYGYNGQQISSDHAIIKNGTCAIDSDFYSDADVMRLGQCALSIFNGNVAGHFMWTVRNELEPRWEYVRSYDAGWIKNAPQEEAVKEMPAEFTQ